MEKQTRRTFLGSLMAAGVLTACGGGSTNSTPPSTSPGSPTLPSAPLCATVPLTIDLSLSNLPAGTPAYAYIIGSCPDKAGVTVYYRLDGSGGIHPISLNDNVSGTAHKYTPPAGITLTKGQQTKMEENYPQKWADYSIPLAADSSTTIYLCGINPQNIPGLGTGTQAFSGRIFISVGYPKLPFTVQSAGKNGLTYAAPAFTEGAPGAQCMYDWIEFSLTANGILDCNTTQVDQFGLPLTISAVPTTSVSPQGLLAHPRTVLMQEIAGLLPTTTPHRVRIPVAAPQLYPSGLSYLRALSPVHVSVSSPSDSVFNTYFEALIDKWYAKWGKNSLIVTVDSTPYVGKVVGNNLKFEKESINYGRITTPDIWQCNGTLASEGKNGNPLQPAIGNEILSAFNRGVMSNSLNNATAACPLPSTYYPSGVVSNLWAQKWHKFNQNGYAYGFPYDDNCGRSTTIVTSGPVTSMTITLGKMFS